MSDIPGLEHDEALIFKWKMGLNGGFFTALWRALAKADATNLEKLALGFPEEVAALKRFRTEPGWWESIEAKTEKYKAVFKEVEG